MKSSIIISFLVLHVTLCQAQVKGNKNVVTRTFPIEDITSIYIGLYADVKIDCSSELSLQITADENLFDKIESSLISGHLNIDQREWIQPSQQIKIRIGAPRLSSLIQSTHETTHILNLDTDLFKANAEVGTIILEGRATQLQASAGVGSIMAKKVLVENVIVDLKGRGKIDIGAVDRIAGTIKEGGTVIYNDRKTKLEVEVGEDSFLENRNDIHNKEETTTRYIKLKLKNNSWKRVNAYVVGPKPNGKKFSYGFPMRPGQVRDEKWTIGSKVYRTSTIGIKKLLVEITEKHEGQIVNLYESGKR